MTAKNQKISVALCTYNGGRFLAEQLESIGEQTVTPDELLISDDGSNDDTLIIVDAFRKTVGFPIVTRVNGSRLGSTRNFENVVQHCSGDVIFLADQDDIWRSDKIEVSLREFDDEKVGFVFTDAALVDEDSRELGPRLFDTTFPAKVQRLFRTAPSQALVWGSVVTGATMAFRSSYRKLFTPTPDIGMFSHDSWFAFTISLFAEPAYVASPLLKYRVHSGQQIGIGARDTPPGREQRAKNLDSAVEQSSKLLDVVESLAECYASGQLPEVDETMLRKALSRIEGVKSELLRFKAHAVSRRDLPPSIFGRLPTIANELRAGNYSKYANGTRSAFADLIY